MQDKIYLNGIRVYANHGLYDEEQNLGQRFDIDVIIVTDLSGADSDNIRDTLDYRDIFNLVVRETKETRFKLIEKLALHLIRKIFDKTDKVQTVTVSVKKPSVPIGGLIDSTQVEITRTRADM